jgi:hypothetical protein
LQEASRETDPAEVILQWFSQRSTSGRRIASDTGYVLSDTQTDGVLIGDTPPDLRRFADRFLATPAGERPLLMHAYLPTSRPIDFAAFGLPRPVPVLPLLLRHGYVHRPHDPPPTCEALCAMLIRILESA